MIPGLELHRVENGETQEMEEKAYEVKDNPVGAHQVYEPHLEARMEQKDDLFPYHFSYLLGLSPQCQR
jgi:hypothetical protein